MKILVWQKNISLKQYNTFGVDIVAPFFLAISSEAQLLELIHQPEFQLRSSVILGGGSNVLFLSLTDQCILLNQLKGIEWLASVEPGIQLLKVGGGENWHDFVGFSLKNHLYGLENLALIPGTVGAAPIQNIGAYGIEVKDFIYAVEVIHLKTGRKETLTNDECEFGYRDSLFKRKKGTYFITQVIFKLALVPQINLQYKDLATAALAAHDQKITPEWIYRQVIRIRESKLPNPTVIGNAGSFFKNPLVGFEKCEALKQVYPDLVFFKEKAVGKNLQQYKISAGFLLEKLGWKGKREGRAGVYEKHPLILINLGGATGCEIFALAQQMINAVFEKTGLMLEIEPIVIRY